MAQRSEIEWRKRRKEASESRNAEEKVERDRREGWVQREDAPTKTTTMYFPDICDINYTKNRPADINPETSCSIIDPDPGYGYIYVGYVGADFDTANMGPPPNCLVTATGRDGATACKLMLT
ncbi:hypothetical protein WR25_23552 [Diploscapter pachys]|uniref:Uncharacterized protein n=1 Tax=Diploscapter pachys TaxID=2018661 RepID=A0A2A2KKB4_9BILA|nr:hypothetical protein WR25_23552 [Diploscapter pachys]